MREAGKAGGAGKARKGGSGHGLSLVLAIWCVAVKLLVAAADIQVENA
jgi:hypothetical protein